MSTSEINEIHSYKPSSQAPVKISDARTAQNEGKVCRVALAILVGLIIAAAIAYGGSQLSSHLWNVAPLKGGLITAAIEGGVFLLGFSIAKLCKTDSSEDSDSDDDSDDESDGTSSQNSSYTNSLHANLYKRDSIQASSSSSASASTTQRSSTLPLPEPSPTDSSSPIHRGTLNNVQTKATTSSSTSAMGNSGSRGSFSTSASNNPNIQNESPRSNMHRQSESRIITDEIPDCPGLIRGDHRFWVKNHSTGVSSEKEIRFKSEDANKSLMGIINLCIRSSQETPSYFLLSIFQESGMKAFYLCAMNKDHKEMIEFSSGTTRNRYANCLPEDYQYEGEITDEEETT